MRIGRRAGGLLAPLAAMLSTMALAAPKVGDPAPKFSVTTFKKEKLDLAAVRGKVVIVNLWATWCVPCREEFLLFEKYSQLRAKHGFTVIAIETGGTDARGPMRKLAEVASFPVVMEAQARAKAYTTIDGAVPTNYVIDRAGVLRYAKAGSFTADNIDGIIRPLLVEPVPDDVAAEPAAAK